MNNLSEGVLKNAERQLKALAQTSSYGFCNALAASAEKHSRYCRLSEC